MEQNTMNKSEKLGYEAGKDFVVQNFNKKNLEFSIEGKDYCKGFIQGMTEKYDEIMTLQNLNTNQIEEELSLKTK